MARPALVIGVGGTGTWVVTHLKKNLLETYNNKMPKEVKLLAFDTLLHSSAMAGSDPYKDRNKQGELRQKKAGAVELQDKIEYVHIGSDLNALMREIHNGRLPHLSWVETDKALKGLPQAALQCTDGAAGIRQLGRLCLLNDLQNNNSKIKSHIRTAMDQISQATHIDANRRLEIIIVGSLAGGTGAGMLVDLPVICRHLAGIHADNIIVRGFIVTPQAFVNIGMGNATDNIAASSFAAWRELDRWMITSEKYGGNQINYSSIDPTLNIQSNSRVYDVTYMLDPRRDDHPLAAGNPEDILFPAIANIISVILDDVAGLRYSNEIVVNIAPTQGAHPSKPLHSVAGAFTIKEPVYYEQMKGAYQDAKEALEIFLRPKLDPSGMVTGLKKDKNVEKGVIFGREAALEFLDMDRVTYHGDPFLVSELEHRIAAVVKGNLKEDKAEIRKISKGSLESNEKKALLDVEASPHAKDLKGEFGREDMVRVSKEVPPSSSVNKNPNSTTEKERIREGVKKFRMTRYGEETSQADKPDGSYGKSLNKFIDAHLSIFIKNLQVYSEMNLMGWDGDPVVARGGKLGWLIGFYEGLLEAMTYYDGWLQAVLDDRNGKDFNKPGNARKSADQAWTLFDRNPKKDTFVTFWDNNIHPKSHWLQRDYLRSEEQVNQVRKEEIILFKLQKTMTAMIKFVESSLKNLKNCEQYLATGKIWEEVNNDGGTVTKEIRGLYKAVKAELENVETNYQDSLKRTAVEDVLDPTHIQGAEGAVSDLLASLKWGVDIDKSEALKFSLELVFDGNHVADLKSTGTETADQDNLEEFTGVAEKPYLQLLAQDPPMPVSKAVEEKHKEGKKGAAALGKYLDHRAEPFYKQRNGSRGSLHIFPMQAFLTVNRGQNSSYIDKLQTELKALDPTVKFQAITDSQDRYKLTQLRFDDCIVSEDFEVWSHCREAYLRYFERGDVETRARDFHVFPAELHACEYEKKIGKTLSVGIFTLHPKVVALLDDEQRVEMFFRALGLGYIREDKNEKCWIYQQTDMAEPIRLTDPNNDYGIVDEEQEVWFKLMNQFLVCGCDVRAHLNQNRDYQVNWQNLRRSIDKEDRSMKISKYAEQVNDANGFVQVLQEYVSDRRANYPGNPYLQGMVAIPHDHLASLAKTIFKIAISELM